MNRIKKIKNKKEIIPLIFIFYPNLFRVFCVLSGLSLVGVFSSCSKTSTAPSENRPQVEVKGPITENTVWESGKDYIVRGEVTVGENATLTIQKDVHVYLTLDSLGNKGKLYVKGGLHADGVDSTTMIFFQPGNVDTGGEEGWGVELFEGKTSSEFKYCSFKDCLCGIRTIKTRLIVSNCSFEYCHNGINISKCDSVFVLDSDFSQNVTGVLMELSTGLTDSCIVVSRNRFFNCTKVAVEVTNSCKGLLITDNYFGECSTGFLCAYYSESKLIYNYFNDCSIGIYFMIRSNGEIKKNIVNGSNNNIYLDVQSYPVINQNNLLKCDGYKLVAKQYNIEIITNAEHNWWDTDSKTYIDLGIFDGTDTGVDPIYGIVDFEPFETTLITDCGPRSIR